MNKQKDPVILQTIFLTRKPQTEHSLPLSSYGCLEAYVWLGPEKRKTTTQVESCLGLYGGCVSQRDQGLLCAGLVKACQYVIGRRYAETQTRYLSSPSCDRAV